MSGAGLSPTLATCETSQVLLAVVSGGFPGVLPFRPTYRSARLDGRYCTMYKKVLYNIKKIEKNVGGGGGAKF